VVFGGMSSAAVDRQEETSGLSPFQNRPGSTGESVFSWLNARSALLFLAAFVGYPFAMGFF